jgi:DNA invertase Pin-like site-specific DNA recombinase
MERYVSYLRVSTDKQGIKGLGIEAQRHAVTTTFGEPIMEFVEVESGKNNNRPQLNKAIEYCKQHNCILAIAKIDRLSRNVSFVANLMDSKVVFKAADNPHIDNFTIHILVAVAQKEREAIATRVKDALAAKKRQLAAEGKRLGCPDVTKDGRTVQEIMLENRTKRVYAKPDPAKVDILKTLRNAGKSMDEIKDSAYHIFGRNLSKVTLYSYLK